MFLSRHVRRLDGVSILIYDDVSTATKDSDFGPGLEASTPTPNIMMHCMSSQRGAMPHRATLRRHEDKRQSTRNTLFIPTEKLTWVRVWLIDYSDARSTSSTTLSNLKLAPRLVGSWFAHWHAASQDPPFCYKPLAAIVDKALQNASDVKVIHAGTIASTTAASRTTVVHVS